MIKLQYKQVNNKQIALYTRTANNKTNLISLLSVEPKQSILDTVIQYLNRVNVTYEIIGTEIYL